VLPFRRLRRWVLLPQSARPLFLPLGSSCPRLNTIRAPAPGSLCNDTYRNSRLLLFFFGGGSVLNSPSACLATGTGSPVILRLDVAFFSCSPPPPQYLEQRSAPELPFPFRGIGSRLWALCVHASPLLSHFFFFCIRPRGSAPRLGAFGARLRLVSKNVVFRAAGTPFHVPLLALTSPFLDWAAGRRVRAPSVRRIRPCIVDLLVVDSDVGGAGRSSV